MSGFLYEGQCDANIFGNMRSTRMAFLLPIVACTLLHHTHTHAENTALETALFRLEKKMPSEVQFIPPEKIKALRYKTYCCNHGIKCATCMREYTKER